MTTCISYNMVVMCDIRILIQSQHYDGVNIKILTLYINCMGVVFLCYHACYCMITMCVTLVCFLRLLLLFYFILSL